VRIRPATLRRHLLDHLRVLNGAGLLPTGVVHLRRRLATELALRRLLRRINAWLTGRDVRLRLLTAKVHAVSCERLRCGRGRVGRHVALDRLLLLVGVHLLALWRLLPAELALGRLLPAERVGLALWRLLLAELALW